jgi:hypothetical protein
MSHHASFFGVFGKLCLQRGRCFVTGEGEGGHQGGRLPCAERTPDPQVDRLFEEYLKWARAHGVTDRPPPTSTGARAH